MSSSDDDSTKRRPRRGGKKAALLLPRSPQSQPPLSQPPSAVPSSQSTSSQPTQKPQRKYQLKRGALQVIGRTDDEPMIIKIKCTLVNGQDRLICEYF